MRKFSDYERGVFAAFYVLIIAAMMIGIGVCIGWAIHPG